MNAIHTIQWICVSALADDGSSLLSLWAPPFGAANYGYWPAAKKVRKQRRHQRALPPSASASSEDEISRIIERLAKLHKDRPKGGGGKTSKATKKLSKIVAADLDDEKRRRRIDSDGSKSKFEQTRPLSSGPKWARITPANTLTDEQDDRDQEHQHRRLLSTTEATGVGGLERIDVPGNRYYKIHKLRRSKQNLKWSNRILGCMKNLRLGK